MKGTSLVAAGTEVRRGDVGQCVLASCCQFSDLVASEYNGEATLRMAGANCLVRQSTGILIGQCCALASEAREAHKADTRQD